MSMWIVKSHKNLILDYLPKAYIFYVAYNRYIEMGNALHSYVEKNNEIINKNSNIIILLTIFLYFIIFLYGYYI